MKSNNYIITIIVLIFILTLSSCEKVEEWKLTEYDGALNWEQITKKADWENRLDPEVAILNDKLYLIGGYNPGVVVGDPYYEDVWESSNGKDWIEVVADGPWKGRRGHSLITFNDGGGDALYLIGGFSVDESTGERAYNNDVWKSTDGVNWSQIKETKEVGKVDSNNWTARMHHKCVVANIAGKDYIYLVGGYTMQIDLQGRYAIKYFNDVWQSENGVDWVNIGKTDIGIRAEFAMTADDNGNIYLQGGVHGVIFEGTDSSGTHPIQNYYNVWSTNDGENWTNTIDEQIEDAGLIYRTGHEMVFYDDKIWVLPGKTNSLDHYHFTQDNQYPTWTIDMLGNWNIDSYGTAIDARHSYASIVWKDKIWVFGGNTNANGQDNDVWAASRK